MKYINIYRLSVHPGFFLTVAAFFLADNSIYSAAVLFCAAFHELGHISAIYLLGTSVERFFLHPFGAEMRLSGNVSYKKESVIALSGPGAGLVLSSLFFFLSKIFPSPLIYFSAVCSFFLSVFNLAPVRGFDGGRAAKCIFLSLFSYEKALRLIRASELLGLLLLSALSAASILYSYCNLSLCIICVLVLFSACRSDY